MQSNDNSETPSAAQGDFTVSNKENTHIPLYWIKWTGSGDYYYQGDSMQEYIKMRVNLLDFPKLTKHFNFSHELTT